MKVNTQTTTLLLALALGVSAWPSHDPPTLAKRDGFSVISSVLHAVETGINNLDAAINDFSGSDTAINSATNALVTLITDGTTSVEAAAALNSLDSISLVTEVMGLQDDASQLLSDLQVQVPAFEGASLCATASAEVSSVNSASLPLITAVLAKVNAMVAAQASAQATSLEETLQSAVAAVDSTNCVNGA